MENYSPLKRLLHIAALTVAVAIVPACKMHEQEAPEKGKAVEKTIPVHFHADTVATKTSFGEAIVDGNSTSYQAIWSGNENGVAVSLNLNGARKATVTPSADGLTATFDADFPQSELQAPYTFYALSPFSASISATSTHGGYHLNIPADQRALANSCDEAAMVLAGSKVAQSIDEFGNVEIPFSHLTAYGRMSLIKMAISPNETIMSIELTASEPFAGQFYYSFENGELTEAAASRTVTITPAVATTVEDNSTAVTSYKMEDIWFACAPANLGGGTLKVVVNTSAGRLTRTVDVPQNGLAFNAGRVSKFAVNMSSAEYEICADRWVLVENASSLAAGDEIILATAKTAGSAYAMSTTQNNNNRGVTSISIATDQDNKTIIQNPGSSVEVLRLVSGEYTGYFYIQEATTTSGRYLYSSNDTNNYLKSGTSSNYSTGMANWKFNYVMSSWCISTYSTVKQNKTNYYKQLRYNSTSQTPIISTYKSSSQLSFSSTTTGTSPLYVFRKEAGINNTEDPILQYSAYGAYLLSGGNVLESGRQYSREYLSDGTVTFAILTPSTNKIAEFNGIPADLAKGDNFTLNYNVITGRSNVESDFEVTVVKVDGPKVWLSDGSGNGFIVKK